MTTLLYQWPPEVAGLGRKALVRFSTCADCPFGIHKSVSGTFIAYGRHPLCLPCARRRLAQPSKEVA